MDRCRNRQQRWVGRQVEIEDVLYDALAEARGKTRAEVCQDVTARAGQIDSLEGVEVVTAAEERFGIVIEDDELTSRVCSSIPLLAALVRTKLQSVKR